MREALSSVSARHATTSNICARHCENDCVVNRVLHPTWRIHVVSVVSTVFINDKTWACLEIDEEARVRMEMNSHIESICGIILKRLLDCSLLFPVDVRDRARIVTHPHTSFLVTHTRHSTSSPENGSLDHGVGVAQKSPEDRLDGA